MCRHQNSILSIFPNLPRNPHFNTDLDKYQCLTCKDTFDAIKCYYRHINGACAGQSKFIFCMDCGNRVTRVNEMSHGLSCPAREPVPIDAPYNENFGKFECTSCHAYFDQYFHLINHRSKPCEKWKFFYCQNCGCKELHLKDSQIHASLCQVKHLYDELKLDRGKTVLRQECIRDRDLMVKNQQLVNLEEEEDFARQLITKDDISLKQFGLALIFIVKFLIRIRGQEYNSSVFSLTGKHVKCIDRTTVLVECIYAGNWYKVKFTESTSVIQAISLVIASIPNGDFLFARIRKPLREYVCSKWQIDLNALRRASITKQFLTLFEFNIDYSVSFDDCKQLALQQLAELTHHFRYDKITTETLEDTYIDHEGFEEAAQQIYNENDSLFYPGFMSKTKFIRIK